jgi:putative ABC transport system substrate-binding protein
MAIGIGRRQFISALGGAAATWPLAAWAQQPALPVIGFLNGGSSTTFAYLAAAFKQGLSETGYVEERNVAIDYRWANEHFDQLPAMAEELVRRNVAVLVATGGDLSARAAKRATDTIPIVFALGGDPVAAGLVASINRPGGNATGVNFFVSRLMPKQLELLCQLVPNAAVIAMLLNPNSSNFEMNTKTGEAAGRALGRQIRFFKAGTEDEINIAFARLIQERVDGLVVPGEPLFTSRRDQLTALVVRNSIPGMFYQREFVAAGALASYGESFADNYRQIGIYAGRILNGEKPANLPVQQPSKFELIINLKAAKALGLTVPLIMQMTADEVIE